MKKLVIYFTIICLTYSLETATFILDNDMLFSDKWYTNGMEVKYDDYSFNKEKNSLKYNEKDTYLIGQKMFVPTTFYKSPEYIDTYDRPFAGYLYFGKLKEKYFENNNYTSILEHEATTSKISEDILFYLMQKGLSDEQAKNMLVNGFCKSVFKKLPAEFAVEAQKLLELNLEGSMG